MASGGDQGSVVKVDELVVVDEDQYQTFDVQLNGGERWMEQTLGEPVNLGDTGGKEDPFEGYFNGEKGQQDQVAIDEVQSIKEKECQEHAAVISKLEIDICVLKTQLAMRNNEKRMLHEQLERMKRENEELKTREKRLKEQIGILTPKCIQLEEKILVDREKHDKQMRDLVIEMHGIEGAVGRMTSTPIGEGGRQEWTQTYTKPWSPEDSYKRSEGKNDGRKVRNLGAKGGAIKKDRWSGSGRKGRSSSRFEKERSRSRDSLYSSSKSMSESEDSGAESETGDEGSINVRRSVLIREVPKISPFRLAGSQDIVEFFKEFEKYCQEKLGENRKFWVKELGEFLDSRLAELYRAIVNVGDPKYEVVKDRIIAHVRRIKGGIKYRKKNEFEEARMDRGEKLETYAHRLESLARKKFGDDNINENKDLMRKFIATVPSYVRETINAKRKDKMKWSKKRLMWWDVLEMIEDREIEDHKSSKEDREDREIMLGRTGHEKNRAGSKSYKDAVISSPVEVMAKFLEEYEKDRERKDEEGWTYVGRNRDRNRNKNQNQRMGASNVRTRMNEVRCLRCGRLGHMKRNCAWANGACFGCGQVGHMIGNCLNPRNIKCFRCGESGHRASDCGVGLNTRRVCGNCGLPGHFARMCEKPRSTCGNCGILGHTASVCRRFVGAPSQAVGNSRSMTQEGAIGQGNAV